MNSCEPATAPLSLHVVSHGALCLETDGVVTAVDAYGIGQAAWRLGAGRARKEDPVSAAAGVVLRVRPGDRVRAGDPLFELRTDDGSLLAAALAAADGAVTVGDAAVAARPLLIDRVG